MEHQKKENGRIGLLHNNTTNLTKIYDFENMYMKLFELKKGNISI